MNRIKGSAMDHDLFANKAANYEDENEHCLTAQNIAHAIEQQVVLEPTMEILDFGAGTGLLLEQFASKVKKMTALDISPAMTQQLEKKRPLLPCELEIISSEIKQVPQQAKFDGIISSLTLHHIEDVLSSLQQLFHLLKPGGFIALADLALEDGSFHSKDDAGIFHYGFEIEQFNQWLKKAGFTKIKHKQVYEITKELKSYPIILFSAEKHL